jgi:beta-barrel assembly-enhancing protease
MSVRAFSSLPMRPIVTLVILCFIVTVLSPASGLASMSVKEEKELGDRLALEIQQKVDMVNDPLIKAYVDEVGRRLVEESHDRRFDYRFYVVKEQTPNAFAIPGGHIFVTSGLIQFVDTEDELAGVIGHEIAHSVLRHIDKAMDRAKRLSLLTLAAIIAGAFLSKDAKGAATLTTGAMAMAQSLMLKYTRENEAEADQKGIKYLTDAGYGSQAMVTFLKKIYRWQRAISPDIPTYLSTHPGIDDRITYLSDTFTTTPKYVGIHPPAAGDLKKMQIRLFLREKGGTEGINQFSSLLREKPGNVDILYGLGVSYVMVGRAQDAISSLSEALKASPNDALIVRELSIAYFEAKEVDKALDLLKDTVRTFPHDTTILYYLAQGNQEKGRWDDALSFYQRVLELEPGRVELYYNLGVVYDKKGVLDLSHENFGLYFKEQGQREIALFHFRKALEYTQDWRKKRELEGLIKECEGKAKRDKTSGTTPHTSPSLRIASR